MMFKFILPIFLNLFVFSYLKAQVWSDVSGGVAGTTPEVLGLFSTDSLLYVGGRFTSAGGISANYIATWDGTNWATLGTGMNEGVYCFAVYNNELYAGGTFTTAGGNAANRIAKWNGTNWSSVGGGMDGGWLSVRVGALAVYGGELYAAGEFENAGGVEVNNIAKWNGSSWSAVGGGLGSAGRYLWVYDSALYVGGLFTTAGGISAGRIAKWDGSTWLNLGTGVYGVSQPDVEAIVDYDSALIIGGYFTGADGVTSHHIIRWNDTGYSSLGYGTYGSPYPYVYALAEYHGQLYAGGYFNKVNDTIAYHMARWDGSNWYSLGSGTSGTYPNVECMTEFKNELYVGGFFDNAGGIEVHQIARWYIPDFTSCSANFYLIQDTTSPHHYFGINQAAGTSPLSYLWSWGDGTFDSTAYPSHTYASEGFYTICLTINDSTGCFDSTCYIYDLQKASSENAMVKIDIVDSLPVISGTMPIEKENILITPNPTSGIINVQTSTAGRLILSDLRGKSFWTSTNSEQARIDMTTFPSGTYILSLCYNKGIIHKKIVRL